MISKNSKNFAPQRISHNEKLQKFSTKKSQLKHHQNRDHALPIFQPKKATKSRKKMYKSRAHTIIQAVVPIYMGKITPDYKDIMWQTSKLFGKYVLYDKHKLCKEIFCLFLYRWKKKFFCWNGGCMWVWCMGFVLRGKWRTWNKLESAVLICGMLLCATMSLEFLQKMFLVKKLDFAFLKSFFFLF